MAVREGIEQRAALTLLNQSVESRVDKVLSWYNNPEAVHLGWLIRDQYSKQLRFRPFYVSVACDVNQQCQRYFPIKTKLRLVLEEAIIQALTKRGYHLELGERTGYFMVPNEKVGQEIANPQ